MYTLPEAVAAWTPELWARLPKPTQVNGFLTGVGSRKTPPLIQEAQSIFAAILFSRGFIWRSGHAEGSDLAFELGILRHPHYAPRPGWEGETDLFVFMPWDGFEPYPGYGRATRQRGFTEAAGYYRAPELATWEKAKQMALEMHPLGERLKEDKYRGTWALHARNMYQPLGIHLDTPSKRTYLWAPPTADGLCTGGTRSAMALSQKLGIPTVNFAVDSHRDQLSEFLCKEAERLRQ